MLLGKLKQLLLLSSLKVVTASALTLLLTLTLLLSFMATDASFIFLAFVLFFTATAIILLLLNHILQQPSNDNQKQLISFVTTSPLPTVRINKEGCITELNYLFQKSFPWDEIPFKESLFQNFVDEDSLTEWYTFLAKPEEKSAKPFELKIRGKTVYAYGYPDGDSVLLCFYDISEQRKFEVQLAQSQKMQAVGQLAGGIAHDFNNLLTAMLGFCDLLLMRHTQGDPSFTDIMQIKQNANRASNLVRQLLAFSRQQTLQPTVLNITDCLAELSNLLRRLIGPHIDLELHHDRSLGLVKVDEGQLEQVIINLVVNARDAMPNGGKLKINTRNYLSKKQVTYGHEIMPAGDYVLIEVIDEGTGIPSEILSQIFDPFFSTKEVGEGTGLGLSTVYGIVKQTGGFVNVESKLQKGTKFSIFLPLHHEAEMDVKKPQKSLPFQDLTGSGTILLVEDEDAVRLFSSRALRGKGYSVIEVQNGAEALDFLKQNHETIDLVISDVVMPVMDGPTLVNHLYEIAPEMKVIFISGYTEESFRKHLLHSDNIQFLPKPFSLAELAAKVQEVLPSHQKRIVS